MNNELQLAILSKFDALSAKLGVASTYVWQAAIREQIIEGVLGVIFAAFLFYGAYVLYSKACSFKCRDKWDEGPARVLFGLSCGAVALFATFFLFFSIPQLINPGWTAFQAVTSALK